MSEHLREMTDEGLRQFANTCAAGTIAANNEMRRRLSDLREQDREWFAQQVERRGHEAAREYAPAVPTHTGSEEPKGASER